MVDKKLEALEAQKRKLQNTVRDIEDSIRKVEDAKRSADRNYEDKIRSLKIKKDYWEQKLRA